MKKLQRKQAAADKRWGFDFPAIDELSGAQQALPAEGFAPISAELDGHHRRLEYVVLALAGEIGELANLVKKSRRSLLMESPPQTYTDSMRDEAADILAYLLKLSNLMDWDLEAAYLDKMARNERRFASDGRCR